MGRVRVWLGREGRGNNNNNNDENNNDTADKDWARYSSLNLNIVPRKENKKPPQYLMMERLHCFSSAKHFFSVCVCVYWLNIQTILFSFLGEIFVVFSGQSEVYSTFPKVDNPDISDPVCWDKISSRRQRWRRVGGRVGGGAVRKKKRATVLPEG